MIICKIPLRISYFGGGTDFPEWYLNNKGMVISTAINKYCYMTMRYLPPFFPFKYRIRYFRTEFTKNIDQIKHPSIREVLKKYHKNISGLEIIHSSDLPSRSGLGSSSAFSVALIKGIETMNNKRSSNFLIAKKAIKLEQDILKEKVGSQDQIACAVGGFNIIDFRKNIKINNYKIKYQKIKILEKLSTLIYIGQVRDAQEIETDKINNLKINSKLFKIIYEIADEAKKIIISKNNKSFIENISGLMNESWNAKKQLSEKVSNRKIDHLYDFALNNGALSGKILGAGAGGFMLFLSKNFREKQKLINLLNKKKIKHVNFNFEENGASIIFQNKSDYV